LKTSRDEVGAGGFGEVGGKPDEGDGEAPGGIGGRGGVGGGVGR